MKFYNREKELRYLKTYVQLEPIVKCYSKNTYRKYYIVIFRYACESSIELIFVVWSVG